MFAALIAISVSLGVRLFTRNRHVRGRLAVSAMLFALYAAIVGAASAPSVSASLRSQILLLAPLVFAFGAINALVAVALNPWREDRTPDRFPPIVQDAVLIALVGVAATVVLQERILAASAAGAVVIGLALKDTLVNLFAGLAIQIEKPFRVGHWVRIAGLDGLVSEVTWRATKMRTKTGDLVIVPNNRLADDVIVNYSEPTPATRVGIEVGASYDTPPNVVKASIRRALAAAEGLSSLREPEIVIKDFAASAVTYQVWLWTADFAAEDALCDRMRCAIYYAFRRERIEIPYPIQVEMAVPAPQAPAALDAASTIALRRASLFAALSDAQHHELAQGAGGHLFGEGEAIVRQGESGSSMFVVVEGDVRVTVGPNDREVARLGAGDYFGEMSLLTGDPRAATVRAARDCHVVEIASEPFRRFVLDNPTALDEISAAVARRRTELDAQRAAGEAPARRESTQSLLGRVRRFFGLRELEAAAVRAASPSIR